MAGRFSRSLELARASWSVVRADTELLWLPVFSTLALLVLLGAFVGPAWLVGAFDAVGQGSEVPPIVAVAGFVFYVLAFFIAFFFNTALVGAAMLRMDGHDPTLRDALAIAWARVPRIFGYALIAATIGLLLRALEERVGWLGSIVVRLVGLGWTVATFLVVPVLVTRDVGPIDAVKESASLLRETWGENLIGTVGMSIAFSIAYLLVVLLGGAGVMLGTQAGLPVLIAVSVLLCVATLVVLTALQATMQAVYAAALYRYATNNGDPTPGFAPELLQVAFKPKG